VAATLVELLERWGAGLTDSAAERRMAIRLSQQRLRLLDPDPIAPTTQADGDHVSALPSVRRLTAIGSAPTPPPAKDAPPSAAPTMPPHSDEDLGGDDDEDADLDDGEDFYADMMDIS
jgi:hypothetical protein